MIVRKNVILVEDEEDCQQTWRLRCQDHGWNVFQAFSKEGVSPVLQAVRLQAAVIDLSLIGGSDRSGLEVRDMIAADPSTSCLLVTSQSCLDSVREFLQGHSNHRVYRKCEVEDALPFRRLVLDWSAEQASRMRRAPGSAIGAGRRRVALESLFRDPGELHTVARDVAPGCQVPLIEELEVALAPYQPLLGPLDGPKLIQDRSGAYVIPLWSLALGSEVDVVIARPELGLDKLGPDRDFGPSCEIHMIDAVHATVAVFENRRFGKSDSAYDCTNTNRHNYVPREFPGES